MMSILDLGSDKLSSSWGILLVVGVFRSDDDAVLANVVSLVADDQGL